MTCGDTITMSCCCVIWVVTLHVQASFFFSKSHLSKLFFFTLNSFRSIKLLIADQDFN